MRVPAHEATTAQLGAAFPFVASTRRVRGVVIGRDLHGGTFVHDAFALYQAGVLTNPNMIVLGQIGRGKSSLVKTYLFRQAALGRHVVVLDPKGEYGPLAEALGSRPICLEPGGTVRLNPLEGVVDASGAEASTTIQRRLALLGGLAASCLGRPLRPIEHAGLEVALAEAHPGDGRAPTLALVVDRLLSPSSVSSARLRLAPSSLASELRELGLGLRRLVEGELHGMFDTVTSPGLSLRGEVVVLDLSAVYHSDALGAIVTCAVAALEASWRSGPPGVRTVLVVDEAWAVLDDLAVARFLQSSWKLARSHGVANVAVVHRVSDLAGSGPAGGQAARIAEGLLSDSETLVCYAQGPAEAKLAAEAFGLSEREATLLSKLRRGVALWRVAGRSYLVEHRVARGEAALVDTDARLRE
jgi:type IV secretory pathway VirB4 component